MKARIGFNYLLASILWLFSAFSFAQIDKIDSLETAFARATSPLEKVEILKSSFEIVQTTNPERGLTILQEIELILKRSNKFYGKAKLENWNLYGVTYMNLSQYDSALFYYQKSLEEAKTQKDSVYISKSYNNIGAVNYYSGNSSNAIYYFIKSAEMDEAIGDIEGSIVSLMNIGSMYLILGNLDSARVFLTKGLDGAVAIEDKNLMATCYLSLGGTYQKENNFREAKKNYLQVVEIAKVVEDYELVSMAYRNLAIIFQKEFQFKIAAEYDLKSLEFAYLGGKLECAKSAYSGLAFSYEKLGMYKEAYENQKEYTNLLDSLSQLHNNQSFIEMQEKYNSEQTKIENQILTQKDKINSLEQAKNAKDLQNSRIIIISSILGLVLLLILAFTLYNRNVLKQKVNLELQTANETIQEKNRDIIASIEYASKIQEALLPTKDNQNLFQDSFYLLKPKDIVSGDFFWYAEVGGKKIIAAVDCTGHGVPGAFMSMIGNTFLHEIVNEKKIIAPNHILNILRRRVVRAMNQKGEGTNRKDGMDMAICTIDEHNGTLDFAGANNPLYVVLSNEMKELKGDKQPVGYFGEKEVPFKSHQLKIQKGDCVYIFSDGYADQFGGPKGKKFKYKQLRDLLFANCELPMQEQKKILLETFESWKGSLEQVDDVCMVGIRI